MARIPNWGTYLFSECTLESFRVIVVRLAVKWFSHLISQIILVFDMHQVDVSSIRICKRCQYDYRLKDDFFLLGLVARLWSSPTLMRLMGKLSRTCKAPLATFPLPVTAIMNGPVGSGVPSSAMNLPMSCSDLRASLRPRCW
jgi:hypothetical protein